MSCVKVARNIALYLFCSYFPSITDESIECHHILPCSTLQEDFFSKIIISLVLAVFGEERMGPMCHISIPDSPVRNVGIPDYL